MGVRFAGQDERVGVIERLGVVVRGAEEESELRTSRYLDAVQLERLEHPPLEHLEGSVEPQQLLDRVREQGSVLAQLLQLVGVPEQRPPSDQRRVHRRLVTGVQEQHARADELVLGEGLALVHDPREAGDEVLAAVVTALTCEPRRYSENSVLARTASRCISTEGSSSYIFVMSATTGAGARGPHPGHRASPRSP